MATVTMDLPQLPTPIDQYVHSTQDCQTQQDVVNATKPYVAFESRLREVFAQQPEHPAVLQNHLVPIFKPDTPSMLVRARDTDNESSKVKDRYLLPLSDDERKKDGSLATVKDLATFKTNFNLFSESSLVDMDWSNVVACGSSVVSALLPVSAPHNESKRALRAYYHQILAPASDVDLFLYGLDEEQAKEKIKQIETSVRDSILSETTTIRTKNAITICSQYPTRHVQIVLRLYKSVSEVLTGFDVDCSCVAYDGKQVWASPRALSAFITQVNTVDLTRRSPSYENRLSKYSHRGFEVFWPVLDRDRVDPTIYERSFSRVLGLARLLVLEKLPHPNDRDNYLAKRRQERGRPELSWNARFRFQLPGNVKDAQPDDVAEWVSEDDVSNYHTWEIPYGPKYNAKNIEKLLFTKDLLLNAEWNRSKDRETVLHRHPAFFGRVEDVLEDCCGFCPTPETDEDLVAAELENKIYISGKIQFLKDDPGRQAIGSFHPLTDDDWTEMAYIGNTARLIQAIVDKDLEGVTDWFESGELEEVDVNRRDHAGRTPLQLATMCSSPQIVQFLIDRGARIVSRIYNGMTALHFASYRGEIEMVKALLERSADNEEEEDAKEEARREARRAAAKSSKPVQEDTSPDKEKSDASQSADEEDLDDLDDEDDEESLDDMTEGSFVKVSGKETDNVVEDDEDEPDVYDIDVLAWDNPLSPLHLAIIAGKLDIIKLLCEEYGADVLLPVKILSSHDRTPENAILTLILALQTPLAEAKNTVNALLAQGAMGTQADMRKVSAVHYAVNSAKPAILSALKRGADPAALSKAMNFLVSDRRFGWYNKTFEAPLVTAIRTRRQEIVEAALAMGAEPEITLESFSAAYHREDSRTSTDPEDVKKAYEENNEQPVIVAVKMEMPKVVSRLIDLGANIDTCPKAAYQFRRGYHWMQENKSLLDIVQDRIRELKESIEDKDIEKPVAPEKLAPDETYLDFEKDSYQFWFALHDLQHAKRVEQYQQSSYESDLKAITDRKVPGEGKYEKKEAVEAVIAGFETVERKLKEKGAKSFYEIFPDAPKSEANDSRDNIQVHRLQGDNKPYSNQWNFFHPIVTDKNRSSYIELFESAWRGDSASLKQLCVRKDAPLQVAVQDAAGFSPFSLALVRGHHELASAILEIATAQHQPAKNEPSYRFRLRNAQDNEYDSDAWSGDSNEGDNRMVLKQIVDDVFSIGDVTALADNVKSKVSPMAMLKWDAEFWRMQKGSSHAKGCPGGLSVYYQRHEKHLWSFFNDALTESRQDCKESLVRRAIAEADLELLKFILRTGANFMALKAHKNDSTIFQIRSDEFELAIEGGSMEIIGEIISATGAAVPLQKMVQSSGAVVDERPEFYQGLSVRGQKRKDWAERDAPYREKAVENEHSPILKAIFIGTLKSVEYFLSDAPLHRYQEFAKAFKDDKRIKGLALADGGVNKALTNWLKTNSDLSLHMAVMSPSERDGSTPLLDYILRIMPGTLDARSKADGTTPLQLAFGLNRLSEARTLIKAGANQATRTYSGQNILHTVLTSSYLSDPIFLKQVFQMLDPKLVNSLLLERCNSPDPGSLTPLALYLQTQGDESVVKTILDQSRGKVLELLNGAGDYVLHTLVRQGEEELVIFLVDYRPEMLYWENATGMIPGDIAETFYLRKVIDSPPTLNTSTEYSIKGQPEITFSPKKVYKSETQEQIESLLDVTENDLREKSSAWRMDRLLKKLAEKYPGKRRVVSVIEANEVARRLAGEQQKRNAELRRSERLMNFGTAREDYDRYSDDRRDRYGNLEQKDNQDEVLAWKSQSDENEVKWDLARWELRIRREAGEMVDEKRIQQVKKKFGLGEGKIAGQVGAV